MIIENLIQHILNKYQQLELYNSTVAWYYPKVRLEFQENQLCIYDYNRDKYDIYISYSDPQLFEKLDECLNA